MPDQSGKITAATIRRRFADTRLPNNPLAAEFPDGAHAWPEKMQERMRGNLTAAGVLIPIIERGHELTVLLTERSPDLKHHAGQVSFPGGRMETGDADIRMTALRETHEEVGIHPEHVEVAGFLNTTATVTGYAITPVVGFVTPEIDLTIDPVEVKTAFEVPLEFLLDEANQEHSLREWEGTQLRTTSFHYANQRIWGATAGILLTLRQHILINR